MRSYQIQNVQIIFKYKALHGPLEICKNSQSFLRGERGGKSGSTELGRTVPLIWKCRIIRGCTIINLTGKITRKNG